MGNGFFGAVERHAEAGGAALSVLVHDQGRRLPQHRHDRAYFSLLVGGGYREVAGEGEIDYGAGTLVFHPPVFTHRDEIGPRGALFFIVTLDAAATSSGTPIRAERLSECPDAAADAVALYRAVSSGTLTRLEADDRIESLVAALARPAATEPSSPSWIGRVTERIHDEVGNDLTLGALAETAGVAPAHLSRAFRRRMGLPLGEYLRRVRIGRALPLLARGDLPLGEVATALGFADHAHFTRTCRAVTGATPRALRRALSG